MQPAFSQALNQVARPISVWPGGSAWRFDDEAGPEGRGGCLSIPAILPSDLGNAGFRRDHGLKLAYVAGSMAHGIASETLVEAAARAGCLGFYGAAGQAPEVVDSALARLKAGLGEGSWGCNLLHSPTDPALEAAHAETILRHGVARVEASAYLDVTLPLVKYRLAGLRADNLGRPMAACQIIAKVSRVEVARKFLSPPPARLVGELLNTGFITEGQAHLASRLPLADDITAEADSGGHTDNRPAITLFPSILALRDRMVAEHRYERKPRVGLAGGIATPQAVAAAFAMGAAYVLVGSVHQACVESGTSDIVRAMLAQAEQADCAMAPAADMFEMGVKVQVLKRGTLFAMRAQKLYDWYRQYDGIGAMPLADRQQLEGQILGRPFDAVWADCEAFFTRRDPRQLARAAAESRHKMALVFRWYLSQASRWATGGAEARKTDFQVWCGPGMGAFNEWTRGTFLADPARRTLGAVALNLMHCAAVLKRAEFASLCGANTENMPRVQPLEPAEIERLCAVPATARATA
jgi:PfaD family protein